MDLGLRDKAALITGGSGGIGASVASTLASEGVRVFVGYYRNEDGAKALALSLSQKGLSAEAVPLDVTDEGQVADAVQKIVGRSGGIDILVNSAGIATFRPLEDIARSEWSRALEVNLTGTFLCMREAARAMGERGIGDIVNIGSFVGRIGAFEGAAYAASKGAISALTRAAALELGGRNIRVNCIAPGRIDTGIRRDSTQEYRDFLLAQTPLGRIGRTSEVAALVALLLTRRTEFLTGETIEITGGLHSVYLRPAVASPSDVRD